MAKVIASKQDLVELLAAGGRTKKDASEAVSDVLAAITQKLANGDDVNLIGFGKFKVTHKPAYQGRNPSTGDPLPIAASNRITFSVGASLKAAANK